MPACIAIAKPLRRSETGKAGRNLNNRVRNPWKAMQLVVQPFQGCDYFRSSYPWVAPTVIEI